MTCQQETRYALTQGNSTTFAGGNFLIDYLTTSLDLTGYTVKCTVPKAYITKDLELLFDSEEQQWYVVVDFTADETLKFPLGDQVFYLTVYDTNNEPCSLKEIPIKVLRRGC